MDSVMQLDRDYLAERCSILNSFLDETISYEMAAAELETLDFKFEALTGLAMIPVLEPAKPFDWDEQ